MKKKPHNKALLYVGEGLLALLGVASAHAALTLGREALPAAALGALAGGAAVVLATSAVTKGHRDGARTFALEDSRALAPETTFAEQADAREDEDEGVPAVVANRETPPEEDPLHDPEEALSPAGNAEPLPTSQLDYNDISTRLLSSGDPIAELKLFVGDIRTRQAETLDDSMQDAVSPAPSQLEIYCARMLEEAGLFDKSVELPRLRVVRPAPSNMLYLQMLDKQTTYLSKVRVIKLEAALNAMRFASTYFDDLSEVTEVQAYKLSQDIMASICAQSPNIGVPLESEEDEDPDGEWAVRRKISSALESLQLPYRLDWSLRANVKDGNVSLKIDLTPAKSFPSSTYVEGIGIVQTSREMRRKAASAYAQRVAILVAAVAFRASEKIKHVWVAGTLDTARRHWCYLSIDFDRWRFSKLDLAHIDDLPKVMRSFVPTMRLEDGILRPIEQTFSPEEARFCPPERYEAVSLSSRRLADAHAKALGTGHVAGLAIEEADKRGLVATNIMLNLVPPTEANATERNVRTILALAGDDPDPSVRSAAERTVRRMVEGTIDDDALSIGEEFVSGDTLTRGVRRAKELLSKKDLVAATEALEEVLEPIDGAGLYADSATVEYRFFNNYVDRALYNRLLAHRERSLALVPDSYFEGHLLLSTAYMATGRHEKALREAKRLLELAPMDRHANLHTVRCLEVLGRMDEARDLLCNYLSIAHDPNSLGAAYYRMAFFQWEAGNLLAAQACYQCALRFTPGATGVIGLELATLALQNPSTIERELSPDQVVNVLKDAGIPVAPTDEVATTFMECARASLDAEIFPVAQNFAGVLASFTADDVIGGIVRSLEDAPD
ncbi:MAG: tetratricopeptide repeat protein [Olsenella sp.]|nr:tetratricopeptide repeat protein [Olsenella sp.]